MMGINQRWAQKMFPHALRTCLFAAALILGSAVLQSCGGMTSTVRTTFCVAPPADAPYDRLLVVDLTEDENHRRDAETRLVNLLAGKNVRATPSHQLWSEPVTFDSAVISEGAKEIGAQGILMTEIGMIDADFERIDERTDIKVTCRGGSELFLYDYEEITTPAQLKIKQHILLGASLYRAQDGQKLWSIQTDCLEACSARDAAARHAQNAVNRLEIEGFIRWPSPR